MRYLLNCSKYGLLPPPTRRQFVAPLQAKRFNL